MKRNVISNFIKMQLPFLFLVGGWGVYLLIYVIFKQHKETVIFAGVLALIGQAGVSFVNALLAFLLWKKTVKQDKTLFVLLCISFLSLVVSDISYNVTINILGITSSLLLTTKISFIGFLIFQSLALGIIFLKSKLTQNGQTLLVSYLSIAMIMLVVFAIFFLTDLTWKIQGISFFKLCCLFIGFSFALLCLAIAANKQIRFIATGFLIIIATDFFVELSHLTRSLLPLSWVEPTWIFGLLLSTFGLSNMLKNLPDLKMDRWLNGLNSVQAQCAFWSFLLCMVLLIAFCGILVEYNLLKTLPLQYLPSVLVVFSVFAVLISSILARVLSAPFERVKVIIDSYMNGKEMNIVQEKFKSSVYEFELLENFLTRSFEVLKEKNKVQLELFNCATQVAHDIRSPLAALDMISKLLTELPEQKRVLVRNATQRINDIANNLLETHRLKGKSKAAEITEDMKPELVSSLLDSLTSEKRIQLAHKSINLILEIQNAAYSSFVRLEAREFKRVISNLINNASEAIHGTDGVICLTLEKESNMLIIKIIDNGKGIPADLLPKIKQGGISIGKKEGAGLGISGAIQNIKKWNGNYDIQSKVGEGTTFTVTLPIAEEPEWFQSTVIFSPNTHIIILDDDESIHNIWQAHFREHLGKKLVRLDHFYEPSNFSEYCKTSRSKYDLFLVDYELINSKETGLDLIEQLDLTKQAILVTSRHEEQEIRERIKTLGIKIIPKSFAPYIPISVVKNLVQKQPELIFIDNDKTLTEAWNLQASLVKKKIATFNRSEDFKKVMDYYNRNIPIYVDSDLNEQTTGEVFAKFLYEQGFQSLYLATGYEKDKFGYMPWIQDIVTKEPPF